MIQSYFSTNRLSRADGDMVSLIAKKAGHFGQGTQAPKVGQPLDEFGSMLASAVDNVNSLQGHSQQLTRKLVYDPKSVDAHTVMIAAEKARVSLSFTKTVIDQAVKAYRELVNMR